MAGSKSVPKQSQWLLAIGMVTFQLVLVSPLSHLQHGAVSQRNPELRLNS
jgi:hypothetical protein